MPFREEDESPFVGLLEVEAVRRICTYFVPKRS